MPVAESGTARELAALARDADRRAEDEEAAYRRLALTLLAFELAAILRALGRAGDDPAAVLHVFTAARASYLSPLGSFRLRWADRFGELMRETAARVARETFGSATLPAPVTRAITARAETLAAEVTTTTATRLSAVARAVTQEQRDRTAGRPPVASPDARIITGPRGPGSAPLPVPATFAAAVDQRLETLVPLVGRATAEQIMAAIRDGRVGGRSIANVAAEVLRTVNGGNIARRRATVIARTETIGLANLTEYELAISRGMTEKAWLDQKDERVRDSHRRCSADGWLPIRQAFSNSLQYPGQRPAPASEVILCRCGLAVRR